MILEDDSFNGVEYLEIDYLFWNSWKRIIISYPLNKRENFAVAAINDTEIVILGEKTHDHLDELPPLIFNTED